MSGLKQKPFYSVHYSVDHLGCSKWAGLADLCWALSCICGQMEVGWWLNDLDGLNHMSRVGRLVGFVE